MECSNPDLGEPHHPYRVYNRRPTHQDLLELSSRIYKSVSKLHSEADSQGMRVYHDELLIGDVRLVMLVPSWFPKAHVVFDWQRLQSDRVSVVFVLRGTMQDLVGNTRANLQLIYNKLVDDQHLPDTATDATKVIQAWLLTLFRRHPQLDAVDGNACTPQWGGEGALGQRPHLDIHITGHSLGGLLSEVATVETAGFAARHAAEWSCTSFESPGLPDLYYESALRIAPKEHWDDVMTSYLAAPNVINMLYRHLGHIVHVVVPWEHTWTFMAKCVGADVARVTAWAIVGSMVLAGASQLAGVARKRTEEEALDRAAAAVAPGVSLQQCDAAFPHLAAASSSAPAALGAAGGPAVPQFLLVAASPSADEAAVAAVSGGRRLLSVAFPPPAAAGVSGAVQAASAASSVVNQQQAASLVGSAVAAAAAAGEAAASFGGARMLQGVLRRSGLGTLAAVLGGWVFGRGGIWGVMECLAGVLGVEVEELISQHALGPMRQCFDPHTGDLKPRYCRKMAAWPHLGTRGKVMLTAAKQVAKWTLPSFVCRDNLGVANIMSRTAMVEARCARLEGYQVSEDTQEAREALGLSADTLTGPSDMYMPLAGYPGPQVTAHLQQSHTEGLPSGHRQHYLLDMPVPRGLGVGLSRHCSTRHHHGQQYQQTLGMLTEVEESAIMLCSPTAIPAPATATQHALHLSDELADMVVDAASADCVFADATQVGVHDYACEGLPLDVAVSLAPAVASIGSPATAGFIHLSHVDAEGIGGALDAVQLAAVAGPSAGQDEEQTQAAGHNWLQVHMSH